MWLMAQVKGYNLKLFRVITAIGQLERDIDNDPTIADEVVEFYEAAQALEQAVYRSERGSPLRNMLFKRVLLLTESDIKPAR